MPEIVNLQVSPKEAATPYLLKLKVARLQGLPVNDIVHIDILRRSIDARQKAIKINLRVEIYTDDSFCEKVVSLPDYPDVSNAESVIIVGAGPAGLFAALKSIELGLKPIIIERGKDVRARRRDLKAITRDHIVNEDSNYCFGEGGAGTVSYTHLTLPTTSRV